SKSAPRKRATSAADKVAPPAWTTIRRPEGVFFGTEGASGSTVAETPRMESLAVPKGGRSSARTRAEGTDNKDRRKATAVRDKKFMRLPAGLSGGRGPCRKKCAELDARERYVPKENHRLGPMASRIGFPC